MEKSCDVKPATILRKRITKIVAIAFITLAAIPIFAFVVLRVVYPGILRVSHKINEPGIDLMEMVEIGGIQQSLYFRGEHVDNPAVLFLHGGPGGPVMPILHGYQYDLEKDFTIINWDQRNSGKTYYANDPEAVRDTMNAQRLLADAHEGTQYIKQKLNKDKIIVLGHSWGSVLGNVNKLIYQKTP